MTAEPAGVEPSFLDELRRKRAELRESMGALELALSSPSRAQDERWAERVHVALVELSADFRAHVDVTEGADGLYFRVLRTSPRLAGAVERLTREHVVVSELLPDLLDLTSRSAAADLERVRDRATELLGTLIRHRQRGSDLVYEAYEYDIGGET